MQLFCCFAASLSEACVHARTSLVLICFFSGASLGDSSQMRAVEHHEDNTCGLFVVCIVWVHACKQCFFMLVLVLHSDVLRRVAQYWGGGEPKHIILALPDRPQRGGFALEVDTRTVIFLCRMT